jgi:hypothetical protein
MEIKEIFLGGSLKGGGRRAVDHARRPIKPVPTGGIIQ